MWTSLSFFKSSFIYNQCSFYSHFLWAAVNNQKDNHDHLSPVKRICVFEHSVMTNFNCACPAIQRGQGSGFLSEGSSWASSEGSGETARMRRLAWTFAPRIGDKYRIRLTRSIYDRMCRLSRIQKVAAPFLDKDVIYHMTSRLRMYMY